MSEKSNGKILVVDDDISWLRNYEKTLTKTGYVVFSASEYQGAIDLVERHYFHAAILDVRLVDKDEKNKQGMEILNLISSKQEKTGIFLVTAYPDFEKSKEAYSKHNILDFVDKQEYDASELLMKLDNGVKLSNIFLDETKKELSNFAREEVSKKIGEKANPDIARILESILTPLTPIKKKNRHINQSRENVFLFASTYWSRFEGAEYAVQIGQRKQILEYASILKQKGKDVVIDTKQSLSGIRYISESTGTDQIIAQME